MNRERLVPWLVPAFAAAAITLLLLVQPAGLLESYDLVRMHQCYKHDLRSLVLAGEWPWWNPYTALGRPFFADVETAVLYPPSWLVVPFGVSIGIIVIVWLHLALAVAGTTRLARRLGIADPYAPFAGIAFALSGALLARIESGQLQLFCVVCLWSFLLDSLLNLAAHPGRRTLVVAALWLALAFLAGSPALLWCGLAGAVALVLGRETSVRGVARALGWCGMAAALALALADVQLLPFVELVQQGNRPLHDAAFATTGGITGRDWLSLLVPPGPWLAVNWESNLHVSALFILLAGWTAITAVKNPDVRALTLMALTGLVFSLGDQTPVLPMLAKVVPGFSGLRYPGRYGLVSALAIALLACRWLSQRSGRGQRARFLGYGAIALQAVVSIAGIFSQGTLYRAPAPALHDAAIRADLQVENLPRDHAPPRSALPVSLQRADAGAQSGTSTLTGFNNPGLARTWGTLYLLAGVPAPSFHRAEVLDNTLFEAANFARYFSLSVTTRPENLAVSFHAPAGPRTFVSFRQAKVARWEDAVEKIRAGHDFVATALVEGDVPAMANATGTGTTRIVSFTRNRVAVDVDVDRAGLLVLAEAWYPGWHASVDGAESAVVPANGWMRATAVPAGRHHVEFRYVPSGLGRGLVVTFLAGFVAWRLWRKPSRQHSAAHAS